MFDFLNQIINLANQYANLILVITTVIYALLTYETVKIMRRQVTANIRIAKINLRVTAESGRGGFKITAFKDLIRRPYGALKDVTFVFHMFADFVNISYGAGAVDQPKLLIKFDHSNFELEVRPTSERIAGRWLSAAAVSKRSIWIISSLLTKSFWNSSKKIRPRSNITSAIATIPAAGTKSRSTRLMDSNK